MEEAITTTNSSNKTPLPILRGTGLRLTEVLPARHQKFRMQENIKANNNSNTAHCENYLCPDTLACVHFPHHCPCAWPSHEDKFELADGQRICISRGGFKAGEAARKVELARKGLL